MPLEYCAQGLLLIEKMGKNRTDFSTVSGREDSLWRRAIGLGMSTPCAFLKAEQSVAAHPSKPSMGPRPHSGPQAWPITNHIKDHCLMVPETVMGPDVLLPSCLQLLSMLLCPSVSGAMGDTALCFWGVKAPHCSIRGQWPQDANIWT